MAIEIVCGSCKSVYTVESDFAGKHVRCGKCGEAILVPGVAPRGVEMPPPVPKRIASLDPLLDPDSLSKGGLMGGKKPAPPPPREDLLELSFADDTDQLGKPVKHTRPEPKSEFPTLPAPAGPGKPVTAAPAEPTFPKVQAPKPPPAAPAAPAAPPAAAPLPVNGRIAVSPPQLPQPKKPETPENIPLAPVGSLVSMGKGESLSLGPPPVPKPSPPCPSCGAPWTPGNAVCPQCGYNSVTRSGGAMANQPAKKGREKLSWTYGTAAWDANDSVGVVLIVIGVILCFAPRLSGNTFSSSAATVFAFIGFGSCVFGLAALAIRERFGTSAICAIVIVLAFRTAVNTSAVLLVREIAIEREKQRAKEMAEWRTRMGLPPSGNYSTNTNTTVTPYVPPPAAKTDLQTFLAGPPKDVDEFDWYLRHLNHAEVQIRVKAARFLTADDTPKTKFDLLARAFEDRLVDADAAIRAMALRALARAPDERSARLVSPLLVDKDPEVRRLSLGLLIQVQDPTSIPAIIARLGEDNEHALAALATFEAKYRDELIAGYEQGLSSGEASVRAACALELARKSGPRSAAALIPLTADGEAKVRSAAIAALGVMKDPKGFDAIAARLRDDKSSATLALEKAGSPAEKSLHAPLKSDDREVRLAAAQVLRRIATKESLQVLQKAAADPDFEIAGIAIEAWAQIAPDTLTPGLTASIDLASADARRWEPALKRLDGVKVDAEHKPVIGAALMKLVIGTDEKLRKLSLALLPTWAPDNAGTTLLTLIQETSDTQQRRYAMLAVGALKEKKAPAVIAKFFETDRPEARDALIALGSAAEDATIKLLYHDTPDVRVAACQVLAEIGTKYKAIPELQKLILDDRANSGPEALKAIDRIRNRPVKKSDTQPAN